MKTNIIDIQTVTTSGRDESIKKMIQARMAYKTESTPQNLQKWIQTMREFNEKYGNKGVNHV